MPTLTAVELRPFEVAFVLQRHEMLCADGPATEAKARAAMRRGERRQSAGQSEDEIVAAGVALPVIRDGAGRRRVPARALRALLEEDDLALDFLDAIVERRLRAPRLAGPTESVPRFSDHSHRL